MNIIEVRKMTGTKVKIFETLSELNSFLKNKDVLNVQYSHSIKDEEWGERHYHTGIWVVWYKEI
jgi:hypothetical protein